MLIRTHRLTKGEIPLSPEDLSENEHGVCLSILNYVLNMVSNALRELIARNYDEP